MEGRSLTIDRISDLPDQILTKILSFLPAEEVVSTWLLSKRWSRVWASVPVLLFDNSGLTDQRGAKFMSFVKGVLDHRDNLNLDTFQLAWWCSSDALPHGFEILSRVVLWMPRVLSIYIYTNESFKMPASIFTCPSVEEMSLSAQWMLDEQGLIEAESIDLPRLKKLELRVVRINDDFIKKLLTGCPVLENLFFAGCFCDVHEISSPILKKLSIDNSFLHQAIEIACPSVMSLDLDTWGSMEIALKNMTSLLAANFYWDQMSRYQYPNLKFLSGLSNVENLSLYTLEPRILDLLLSPYIPNYPTFNNLKRLKLGELDMNLHWNLVVCLLRHSPNLKTLILHFCQPSQKTLLQELEEELLKEELLEDASFRFEYLERVKIECPRNSAKLAEEVVCNLRAIVKSIGEVIIK